MASGYCSPLIVTRFEFRRRDIPDRLARLQQAAGVEPTAPRARGASEPHAVAHGAGGMATCAKSTPTVGCAVAQSRQPFMMLGKSRMAAPGINARPSRPLHVGAVPPFTGCRWMP